MSTETYLGNPPEHIAQWIKDHSGSAGHPDTRFTLQDGTVETYNITGTLDRQWMIANGYFDEGEWEWIKTITQTDIGNTVTSIGEGTFADCRSLISVTIPNSVTSIGENAFSGCIGLMNVVIPDSVMSIWDYAFYDCSGLTSVTIPNSVMSIGGYTFYQCSGLMSVTIGNGVTSIGEYAFYGCNALTSLTFEGKTLAQVQEMDNYSWGISDTSIIHVA